MPQVLSSRNVQLRMKVNVCMQSTHFADLCAFFRNVMTMRYRNKKKTKSLNLAWQKSHARLGVHRALVVV